MTDNAEALEREGDAAKALYEAAIKRKDKKAGAHLLHAIDCFQKAGAERKAALNLVAFAGYSINEGEFDRAEEGFERALIHFEALSEKHHQAVCHVGLAALDQAYHKNFVSAERRYGQALEIFREVNDQENSAGVFASIGDLADLRGDTDTARDNWGKALVRYTNVGKRFGEEGKRLMALLGSA